MARIIGRREFLARSGVFVGAALLTRPGECFAANQDAIRDASSISFETTDAALQKHYQSAIDLLAANVQIMRDYPKPVVAMLVGRHAPAEKRMGHAGALIGSAREGADAKLAALAAAGCRVAKGPEQAVAILQDLGLAHLEARPTMR